ncbi:MAG TPA: four helix bundle protein, partial [Daejeonella sp.]|nr:four helix bundle protein [Daejeonella sp.]
LHFLSIARGSLFELETQLYISKDLLFITDDQPVICLSKIESIGKLLSGLKRYYLSQANSS